MIEQSLCHHLQHQLTDYYKLIAELESKMPEAPEDEDHANGIVPTPMIIGDDGEEEPALTLRRLDVLINEWTLRMRMMSVCVEGARSTPLFISKLTWDLIHVILQPLKGVPS